MPQPDDPLKPLTDLLKSQSFLPERQAVAVLTDPITETPMTVTLDQLRPYDLNPRKMRNPRYDDIKASIREVGMNAPPVISRRPGEPYFRILHGGNTRLAILTELWTETKDERFLRFQCLFRPWPERGEIIALTGHLAEDELHGRLTFIERALGVERAGALYEQETGKTPSQSQLARLLKADGFPIQQSHISRMREAIQHLLPAIPQLLFGGMGRHQIERLVVLRKAAERIWSNHAKGKKLAEDFAGLFQETLSQFDGEPASFSLKLLKDELIGRMTRLLGIDYDTLAFDLAANESRQNALQAPPSIGSEVAGGIPHCPPAYPDPQPNAHAQAPETTSEPQQEPSASEGAEPTKEVPPQSNVIEQLLRAHTTSPEATNELSEQAAKAWQIKPEEDEAIKLRPLIAQIADELAPDRYTQRPVANSDSAFEEPSEHPIRCLDSLLTALIPGDDCPTSLAALLIGAPRSTFPTPRLSDLDLIKLFRLIRLARRLQELSPDSSS
ncbi:ParB family protein [Pseudomonas putida]|uniref:Chromosome partitioning protein ParB n=1 Tax=Pseudomonas putida TaxID=303 RepID=A0A177SV13_PSEPU|nr:ParB family protein [Pseudomonas putida]OAI94852.1 hypothetical protein AYO28_07445 [Pseudomonas putida]